ncbi:MAG TPA: hypothetical protein VFO03_09595 [Gaiellaceae bacterium]|nr:hypothetical protein [Gaiellaceae bacterium]
MIARIATFEGVNPTADTKLMERAEEIVKPIMRGMTGFQGHLELMDQRSGKALSISLFDTEENALAAESTFDQELPKALGEIMEQWSGRRVSVDRYEVMAEDRIGTTV